VVHVLVVLVEMVVVIVVVIVVVGYWWWCSGVGSVGDSLCRVAVVILVVAL
jgi:hypothetical protein